MKWIAIAGSWKITNPEIEKKVVEETRKVISQGNGIVSGGALGVDLIATEEAVKMTVDGKLLKIIIPSSLEVYEKHYLKRAEEKVITKEQADKLISLLKEIKIRGSLVEGEDEVLNKDTYFNRITKIIENADELIAFQVNQSPGTQDTIDKAKKKGIPVTVLSYSI
jgi:uncharacterized phage-like protein YoqJ